MAWSPYIGGAGAVKPVSRVRGASAGFTGYRAPLIIESPERALDLEPQHRGEQLSLELRLSQGIDPVLAAPGLIEEGVRAELVHVTVEVGEDLLQDRKSVV